MPPVPPHRPRYVHLAVQALIRNALYPLTDPEKTDLEDVADAVRDAAESTGHLHVAQALDDTTDTDDTRLVAALTAAAAALAQEIIDAADPLPPAGLAARPVLCYIIHCGSCGKPAPGHYTDDPAAWDPQSLHRLSFFHLDESGWKVDPGGEDPELGGRRLVCPDCWTTAWCDTCAGEIHAWQDRVGPDDAPRHSACEGNP